MKKSIFISFILGMIVTVSLLMILKIDFSDNYQYFNEEIETLNKQIYILENTPIALPANTYPAGLYNLKYTEDEDIFNVYGKRAYETLENSQELLDSILKIYPKFTKESVQTALPSKIVEIEKDNRKFLILNGCTPHDCGGSKNIIAFNLANNISYLLRENHQGEIQLYGKPDALVIKMLLKEYN